MTQDIAEHKLVFKILWEREGYRTAVPNLDHFRVHELQEIYEMDKQSCSAHQKKPATLPGNVSLDIGNIALTP